MRTTGSTIKIYFFWTLASAVMLILLPYTVDALAGDCAGILLFFLLFCMVNPLYALTVGVFAGQHVARLWALPAVPAVVFFLSALMLRASDMASFAMYALVYLMLGVVAMFVAAFVVSRY